MSRLAAMVAASLAAALAVAGPAPATVRLPAGGVEGHPRLGGGDVLWLSPGANGRVTVRGARAARGRPATLTTLPVSDREDAFVTGFEASASGWAVAYAVNRRSEGSRTVATELVTAGRMERGRRVARCPAENGASGLPALALSGSAVAWITDPCSGRPGAIEVRDPLTSPLPTAVLPPGDLVGMAGDLLATRRAGGRWIDVYDWRRGTPVRSVEAGRLGFPGEVALAEDGALAFSHARRIGGTIRLGVAGPAESVPRTLPVSPLADFAIRLAGDRLAFRRLGGRSSGRPPLSRFSLYDLSTGETRDVLTGVPGARFDFDGDRFAWVAGDCRGLALRVTADLGPRRAARLPRCRRLRLAAPLKRTGRASVRVRFTCTGFTTPDGSCRGRVTLRTMDGQPLGSRRGRPGPERSAGTAQATVILNRRGRALLRSGRRVRMRATVRTVDDYGRRERRTTRVTMRPR